MTDPILSHKLKRGEDEKLEAFDGKIGLGSRLEVIQTQRGTSKSYEKTR